MRWASPRHVLQRNKYTLLHQALASLAEERHWGTRGDLVEYHCKGQGAGALALWGVAERTGFPRPIEKVAKWGLTAVFHHIKAVKTQPNSPQWCTERKQGNRHKLQWGKFQQDRRKKSPLAMVLYWKPERQSPPSLETLRSFLWAARSSLGISHAANMV